ncbi:hypothetical protein [Syntrophobacter fumaroxidans]|uniref:hypothetical protein n=1 Tax=Syntrophobacter fumaroxidans TaxID=119484 RepID=UPI001237146F|nr:hypothetical protein [Syntrophobacter fumaroxidans]
MKYKKKTSFFKKIFGGESACCSLDIEEIDSNDEKSSDFKNIVSNRSCCSTLKPDLKKDGEGNE